MTAGGSPRAWLYWHTVRHLKPVQIGARLWRKLPGRAPRIDDPPPCRAAVGVWATPATRAPSMCGAMTFTLLNETRTVGDRWAHAGASALWLYNLHYFDDLNAEGAHSRRDWHLQAIEGWIRSNPPGVGVGWDPYPASLRIVNWIKFGLGSPSSLNERAIESLATQLRHLDGNLEYHLLGNHLFANAKALLFGGLFFEGAEADQWLAKAMTVLSREVPEQILADGAQFERSTMYSALAFEDMLDMINVSNAYSDGIGVPWRGFVSTWPSIAGRMRSWLQHMRHPDGEISFFNDAAIGNTSAPAELERYADALSVLATEGGDRVGVGAEAGVRAIHLVSSGYLSASAGSAKLFIDVAPVGPDYLPGHAHADTLSFELSVHGRRLIVNGGTSRYGNGPERDDERSTLAHSTVTINEQDSSEVWGGFRVARRARPIDLQVAGDDRGLTVSCGHDGYRRLAGRPTHRRRWRLERQRLSVEDRIEGTFESAVARYIFHPGVSCSLNEAGTSATISVDCGSTVSLIISGGRARIEVAQYHPEFGKTISTQCLVLAIEKDVPATIEVLW